MTILDLQPAAVWKHFHALTQVPRPSKKEEKVRAFLKNFGQSLGLETLVDEIGNVIIRKPASPGMENRKGVILQAHMDMVPQKHNAVEHDFEKDPIQTRIEGDWVYACGTTLGADNGMGVAAAMAVLEDKTLVHGPLEVLITTDEETGMTGAQNLKPGVLQGEILLNLDSEEEGEFYIGCAGGVDAEFTFDYATEPVPADMEAFRLNVTGLKGGHSGMEINLGRGNANKILARLLVPMMQNCGVRLAAINGGNMRNAIPREADAIICVPKGKVACCRGRVESVGTLLAQELSAADPGVQLNLIPCELPQSVIEAPVALKAMQAIHAALNGVYCMSASVEGLVETSSNLAIVEAKEGKLSVICLIRSMVDSCKEDMAQAMAAGFALAGAQAQFCGAYSGWSPNPHSAIMKEMIRVYKDLYHQEPKVMAIHAGLECGILSGAYPHWDMISFGPTLRSPHSPEERCYIPSVPKFYEFLLAVLKEVPVKA